MLRQNNNTKNASKKAELSDILQKVKLQFDYGIFYQSSDVPSYTNTLYKNIAADFSMFLFKMFAINAKAIYMIGCRAVGMAANNRCPVEMFVTLCK